jgi:NAD(P)-dependent dehydrogenase (short-subunit alcohol dehydrogenase family)
MDWNGQVAVVTGGSRGIGAAICRRLAARGAAVGINYVAHSTEAEALRAKIVAAGGRAALLQADVADSAAVAIGSTNRRIRWAVAVSDSELHPVRPWHCYRQQSD